MPTSTNYHSYGAAPQLSKRIGQSETVTQSWLRTSMKYEDTLDASLNICRNISNM